MSSDDLQPAMLDDYECHDNGGAACVICGGWVSEDKSKSWIYRCAGCGRTYQHTYDGPVLDLTPADIAALLALVPRAGQGGAGGPIVAPGPSQAASRAP